MADLAAQGARCVALLRTRPSGLFTDIDGTISHMMPRPDESRVEPVARAALDRLAARLDLVGVVTGRALDVAEGLVGLPNLVYVGNHGLERSEAGQHWDHPDAVAARSALQSALGEVGEQAESLGFASGLILEDKRLSATVHFRQMSDPDRFADAMSARIHDIAGRHQLRVIDGRMIFELRPDTEVSKGTALRDLIFDHGLKAAIFAGDDTTDVDGFRVIRSLREQGTIDGLAIGVVSEETPVAVLEESDMQLGSVEEVAAMFTRIADQLDEEAR